MEALTVQLDALLTEEAYIGLIQPLVEKSEKTGKTVLEDWREDTMIILDLFNKKYYGKFTIGCLDNNLGSDGEISPNQTLNIPTKGFSETSEPEEPEPKKTNGSDRFWQLLG